MTAKLQQDVPFSWEEEMNEQADRLMEQRGETIPPMNVLVEEAATIEKSLAQSKQSSDTGDDLSVLMSEAQTTGVKPDKQLKQVRAVIPRLKGKQPKPSGPSRPAPLQRVIKLPEVSTQKDKVSPITPDVTSLTQTGELVKPGDEAPVDSSYQESFTSQQESAAMREQIESLNQRMISMEATLEALLAERAHLPDHIKNVQTDLNSQLTIMSDRLYTALERNIDHTALNEASIVIKDARDTSDANLTTIAESTASNPDSTSPIASSVPLSQKKKKVRLVA